MLPNLAANLRKVTVAAAAANIHQKLRLHHQASRRPRRSQPHHHLRHPSLNRRTQRPIIAAAIIHPVVANQVATSPETLGTKLRQQRAVVVNRLQNPKKNQRNQ